MAFFKGWGLRRATLALTPSILPPLPGFLLSHVSWALESFSALWESPWALVLYCELECIVLWQDSLQGLGSVIIVGVDAVCVQCWTHIGTVARYTPASIMVLRSNI